MGKIEIKNTNILVSVIIPTYKRETFFLERCIESILAQSYENVEAVIVDDNDIGDQHNLKTAEFISGYTGNEKVIYIKTPKNIGAALSRNLGIENAKGEYITFLDDDDVYLTEKIEKQLHFMLDNTLEMSFTDIGLYNMEDKLIDYRRHNYVKDFSHNNLMRLHVMHNLTGTPTYMFKTESLKKIGGFEGSILSDEYYLMEKAINQGLKIGYIPISYVKAYRHNMGSKSFGTNKIVGEKVLYKSKKKYFHLLNGLEKRYARCRYFAVMAVSYYRNKKILFALFYSFCAFIFGPDIIFNEIKRKNKNIKRYKNSFY